jgi:hypothetical protein
MSWRFADAVPDRVPLPSRDRVPARAAGEVNRRDFPSFVSLLRTAYTQTPKWCFWVLAVASGLLGVAVAAPFGFLISRDQVGVAALLLTYVWELFFPLMTVLVAYVVARETSRAIRRGGKWGARVAVLAKGTLGCLLSLSLGLVVLSIFWANVRYHIDLRRLPAVREIRVGCNTIAGAADLAQLAAALRQARWFAPISHGWTKDIPLVIELESGGERRWYVHRILYQRQAVILSSDANPGMVISRDFAGLLERRGLWHVQARTSEYGSQPYYEISGDGECK